MTILRAAVPEDYDAFVPLFRELDIPEPPPSREAFGARFIKNMTVATTADDRITGFIRWRTYGDLAHVINLVTDPAWRGQRIGQVLLERVRGQARAAGCTHWYLNVKQNNVPAIALYTRCGFVRDSEASVLRMPWASVRTLPVPAGLVATVGTESDDAVIASTFNIPLGRATYQREKSQCFIAHEPPDPTPRGVAAFYASMPGVAPLCARDAATAGALLHTCLAFAEPEQDSLIVVVEHDAQLASHLRAAGAALEFELFSLSAPL